MINSKNVRKVVFTNAAINPVFKISKNVFQAISDLMQKLRELNLESLWKIYSIWSFLILSVVAVIIL